MRYEDEKLFAVSIPTRRGTGRARHFVRADACSLTRRAEDCPPYHRDKQLQKLVGDAEFHPAVIDTFWIIDAFVGWSN
jgi:hypothetical protein